MHTVVDLASNTVVVGSEILEANTRTNAAYGTYSINRVKIAQRIVGPPNSVKIVIAKLSMPQADEFTLMRGVNYWSGIEIPPVLFALMAVW